MEDTNVNFEYWEEISSGTTGTIVPPTGSSFVLDQWPGNIDAVVSTVDTGNVPDGEFARTAGGVIVTTTLDSGGNYVLSGTPASYPVAIIYAATVPLSLFDDTKVLGQPELDEGYVRALGLSGGQTIIGGTGSSNPLKFVASSHADGGPVQIGMSSGQTDNAFEINSSGGSGGDKLKVDEFGNVTPNSLVTNLVISKASNQSINFNSGRGFALAGTSVKMAEGNVVTVSGEFIGASIKPTYNQTSGTASNTDLLINRTETAVGSGAQYLIDAQVDDVSQMNVANNGDILNTNGVYGTISDADLKDKIVDAGPKLAELMMVNFFNYELIGGDGLKLLGPLAQELEKVWPGLVQEVPHMIQAPDLEWEPGEKQKITKGMVITEKIEVALIDGKYTEILTTNKEEVETPVFSEHQLYNSDGSIKYLEKKLEDGTIENTPVMHNAPVMEAETEVDRPIITKHDGLYIKTVKQSVFIWILCICMQELTRRVETLES